MVELDGNDRAGAVNRVYLGIMQALEDQTLSPGQRLVDADLASRFGVGRNAVREAMQKLATRGVVDLNRYRSASIRELDLAETMEILSVAAVMTAFAARLAAIGFEPSVHSELLATVMGQLADETAMRDPTSFSHARRSFYRSLLSIGGNRELQRLFPAIGMHIIYSQFRSPALRDARLADYRRIGDAIVTKDVARAEAAGREHVEGVRSIIEAQEAANAALDLSRYPASWRRERS